MLAHMFLKASSIFLIAIVPAILPAQSSLSPIPTYVDSEAPAGALDGVNNTFTVKAPPVPAASLALYRNGLKLSAGSDYTLSRNTISFRSGAIPQAGDSLSASYRVNLFPGVYDDRDPRLTYSGVGWIQTANGAAYSGTEMDSRNAGDSVSFTFAGTQVSYIYRMSANIGYAAVAIDGQAVNPSYSDVTMPQTGYIDGYLAPTPGGTVLNVSQKISTYSGLSNGVHTITITVTGQANSNANDHYVTIDAFVVGLSQDISSAYLTYSGAWVANNAGNLWSGHELYTTGPASSTFSFTGSFLTLVFSAAYNRDIASITIDGVTQLLDQYIPAAFQQMSHTFGSLNSGSHTITIAWTSQRNTASIGPYVDFEQFITAQ